MLHGEQHPSATPHPQKCPRTRGVPLPHSPAGPEAQRRAPRSRARMTAHTHDPPPHLARRAGAAGPGKGLSRRRGRRQPHPASHFSVGRQHRPPPAPLTDLTPPSSRGRAAPAPRTWTMPAWAQLMLPRRGQVSHPTRAAQGSPPVSRQGGREGGKGVRGAGASAPAEPHHSPAPADTPATPPRSRLLRPASLLPPGRLSLGTGRLEPPTHRGGRPAAPPGPARPSARRLTPGPRLPPGTAASQAAWGPAGGCLSPGRPEQAVPRRLPRPPRPRSCQAGADRGATLPLPPSLQSMPSTPSSPSADLAGPPLYTHLLPAGAHPGASTLLHMGTEAEKLTRFLFCSLLQACSPPTNSPSAP